MICYSDMQMKVKLNVMIYMYLFSYFRQLIIQNAFCLFLEIDENGLFNWLFNDLLEEWKYFFSFYKCFYYPRTFKNILIAGVGEPWNLYVDRIIYTTYIVICWTFANNIINTHTHSLASICILICIIYTYKNSI